MALVGSKPTVGRPPPRRGLCVPLEQFQYDALGRLIRHTNALGGVSTYGEGVTQNKLFKTNTYPDGGTRIEEYYRDGRLKKVTGTAVHPARYEYGVTNDGGVYCEYTKEIKLDSSFSDTSEWTKNYTDAARRNYKTVYADSTPGSESDNPCRQSWYNNQGQLWKEKDPDNVFTAYRFNELGERAYSVLVMGSDRIYGKTFDQVSYEEFVYYFDGHCEDGRVSWFQHWAIDNGGQKPNVVRADTYLWDLGWLFSSRSETTVDGLQTWKMVWRDGWQPDPASTTYSATAYDRPNRRRSVTVTAPDGTGTVSVYQDGRLASVTRTNSAGGPISQTTYGYDAQGRQNAITDARNGSTVFAYNDGDQVITSMMPALGNGEAPQVTTTAYDKMGRTTGVQHPDGTTTSNLYFLTGLLQKTWGSRTYPVEYTYDAQGRMKTMKTWQNHAGSAGTATTTWNYDAYRGWLSSKRYPDETTGEPSSVGPNYTNTPGGRLKTRTWARGIITTYTYGFDDAMGDNDHGDLVAVSYSNDPAGTPDVSFAYDRRGRRTSAGRNWITTTFIYDDANELLTESYSGGTLNGLSVNSAFNNQLQRGTLKTTNGTTELQSVAYGYDTAGRLQTVTEGNYSATYAYHANSSLIDTVTFKNGQDNRLITTRRYDRLNRLESISSVAYGSAATNLPISYAYQYNRANQRTRVSLADGAYWVYQYDALGQVISGKKYWSDGTPVAGQQFEYGFDDIGNRLSTKAGGDENGNALRSASYTPNRLNQYSQRTVPGGFDVLGIANVGATVTVNSVAPYRRGEYFRREVSVANGSGPVYQDVSVVATLAGYPNDTTSGKAYVPQTPENYTYDADGNLLSDGRWTYTWDAENRLVQMIRNLDTPAGTRQKLVFEYDYQGRRIRKQFFTYSGGWQEQSDLIVLYDDWNLVAELNANAGNAKMRTYVWGLDLSGAMQGAGGVGGMLKMAYYGSGTTNCFATYDGNGNLTALFDTLNGSILANYEYGPFGEGIRANGPLARANPYRFSTKYTDEETDLVYYGYRYLSTATGRWLSRDPIEEEGGRNLHAFLQNQPIAGIDYLGMFGNPIPKHISAYCCGSPPKSYDNKTHCCCKNGTVVLTDLSPECQLVEWKLIPSGVVTHKGDGPPTVPGTRQIHVWLEWSGYGSDGSADSNAFNSGKVAAAAAFKPDDYPPEELILSPCQYDFKKLHQCLSKQAEDRKGKRGPKCMVFVRQMIEACVKRSEPKTECTLESGK